MLLRFTVEPLYVELGSNGAVPVGGRVELCCRSQASDPPVVIVWLEDGSPMVSYNITTDYIKGDFPGTKVQSKVVIPAERRRNGREVSCKPWFDGELLEDLSQQLALNVTCKCAGFFLTIISLRY